MFMRDPFNSNLVLYKHKRLIFAGVIGTMSEQLENVGPLIRQSCPTIEIAHVQHQLGRRFLALFDAKGPLDITIAQYSPLENSVVGSGVDSPCLIKTMKDITRSIDFVPNGNQMETGPWGVEFELEKKCYSMCERLSRMLNQPLERTFGLVRYTNFLIQYRGESEESAQRLASSKFGISLPYFN